MMESHVHAQGGCVTIGGEEAYQYTLEKIARGGWDVPEVGRDGLPKICIPITCHIVRFSDGSEGIPEERIDLAIENLNIDFESVNMEFFREGDFVFLDSNQFAEIDVFGGEWETLFQQSPVEGTVNVWFVPEAPGICGLGTFPIPEFPNQGILMVNDCTATASNRSTFSHEFGHYFNLFHTFRGSPLVPDNPGPEECVDGSNCETAGDLICDTNADFGRTCSNGNFAANGQCQLTCNELDPCGSGDFYDPPLRNLMSYTIPQRCRSEFTAEQLARMRAVALDERVDPGIPGNIDYPDCLVSEEGACCNIEEGTCFNAANSSLCTLVNSNNTFMGAGTSCLTLEWGTCNAPDGEQGACCIGIDCLLVSGFAECVSRSGVYFGNNTNCTVADCEAIPGGCCFSDDCQVLSEDVCIASDGTFLGPNSICTSGACEDVAVLLPIPQLNLTPIDPDSDVPDGYLGNAIDLDDSQLLIGAMGSGTSDKPNTGAAYVLDLDSGNAPTLLSFGRPDDDSISQIGDFFGCALDQDFSGNSGAAIIGAYKRDYFEIPYKVDAGIAYVYTTGESWNNDDGYESPAHVIENPTRSSYDYFGYDVAIGQSRGGYSAVIGSPRANSTGSDSGAVFWFDDSSECAGSAERIPLENYFPDSPGPLSYCGQAVAMCVSGVKTWAAISAPGHDDGASLNAGTVYVLQKPLLVPGQSCVPPFELASQFQISSPDPTLYKQFGRSVDLYDDNGTPYLIVGALLRQDPNDASNQGSGVALVYKYSGNFPPKWTRMNPVLVQLDTQPLYDNCGESVTLTRHDGDLLAMVGCPSANVDSMISPGAVLLFKENGGEWEYSMKVVARNRQPAASFGYEVAIDDKIVVGAPNASIGGSSGGVYVDELPNSLLADRDSSRDEVVPVDLADLGSESEGIGHADGVIGLADVRAVIDIWGVCDHGCDYFGCHGDLNGDCRVDSADLLIVLSKWND
ncbi:MAG: hypothetical protein CMJ40_10905 [Phycisphaerae bacterium]|nr:hypothetical protein [Phycisphaerae bacterium]